MTQGTGSCHCYDWTDSLSSGQKRIAHCLNKSWNDLTARKGQLFEVPVRKLPQVIRVVHGGRGSQRLHCSYLDEPKMRSRLRKILMKLR